MADKKEKHSIPDGVVVLEDDLGNVIHFEYLDIIEYEGIEYAILFPLDDDNNQVAILRINFFDGETEELSGVEDEDTLNTVFEIFMKSYSEEE